MKILAILLIVFVAQISISAQSEKEVAAVRTEVNAINKSVGKLKKQTKSVSGVSLEGTEATYFLSGKEIKKITAKIYGETYNAVAEIYLRNNAPIFVFSKQNKYDAPINPKRSPKIMTSEEQRIYFSNGETVKILLGKTELKSSDSRYADIQSSLVEISKTLINGYSAND